MRIMDQNAELDAGLGCWTKMLDEDARLGCWMRLQDQDAG